jgi:hypothetical protein
LRPPEIEAKFFRKGSEFGIATDGEGEGAGLAVEGGGVVEMM